MNYSASISGLFPVLLHNKSLLRSWTPKSGLKYPFFKLSWKSGCSKWFVTTFHDFKNCKSGCSAASASRGTSERRLLPSARPCQHGRVIDKWLYFYALAGNWNFFWRHKRQNAMYLGVGGGVSSRNTAEAADQRVQGARPRPRTMMLNWLINSTQLKMILKLSQILSKKYIYTNSGLQKYVGGSVWIYVMTIKAIW